MSTLDHQTTRLFLAKMGVTPDGDPERFDRLQRELGVWWAAGGSFFDFVAHHQAADSRSETRSAPEPDWRAAVTFEERLAVLRRRYVVPPG